MTLPLPHHQKATISETASSIAVNRISCHFHSYFVSSVHLQVSYIGVTELQERATILATLAWLPASVSNVPNLKFIQCFSAGINHLAQHPVYKDSDIVFSTASGTHGPQIAEWVIMTNLIHTHNYLELYEAQKQKSWQQSMGMDVQDRVGRRVGVLGYGSIGRQGSYRTLSYFYFRYPARISLLQSIDSKRSYHKSTTTVFIPQICNKHFQTLAQTSVLRKFPISVILPSRSVTQPTP